MTDSMPREVAGKWYPVPMPPNVPASLYFPSEAACAGFLEGVALVNEDDLRAQWESELEEAVEQADSEGYDRGFDDGEEHGRWEAEKEAEEIARSAETA